MTFELDQTSEACTKYLLSTQLNNGSWNGPLGSRIRETYLVYELAKRLNWPIVEKTAISWLDTNSRENLGQNELEVLLNKQLLNLLNNRSLSLVNPALFDNYIIRKTLGIYSLALIKNLNVKIIDTLSHPQIILNNIQKNISRVKGNIKGWALTELICIQIIIKKYLSQDPSTLITTLIGLQDQKDSWFYNPATTALALITLTYTDETFTFEKYKIFFKRQMQPDQGWSYCSLPLWDTGLSLESLNNVSKRDNSITTSIVNAEQYLYSTQNEDGGWGFNEGLESEADTTSIILYSLRKSQKNIMVEKAINYYKDLQF
jgi:hypothetical protein